MKKQLLIVPFLLILPLTSCMNDTAKIEQTTLTGNIKDALTSTDPISSTGEDNILVVPLNLDSTFDEESLNKLNLALNGTQEETGYYSFKEYINISSYNKLNVSFTTLNPISSSYIINDYEDLVKDTVKSIKDVDYPNFDKDNDNIIDSIYFVYKSRCSNYTYSDRFKNNFTKHVSESIPNTQYKTGNVSFVDYDTIESKYESYYETKNLKVDCHELVHQFGYVLGLVDECDFRDLSGSTGLYNTTMMSGISGDFSSSDKILLGWANTYICSGKYNVKDEISSFETSGDVILWSNHTISSVFDEYLIFDIYSNELLNKDQRVKTIKENETFYVMKATKVNNLLNTNANGKIVSKEKEFDSSAFKYDNSGCGQRLKIKLKKDYDPTVDFTKTFFYLSGEGSFYSEMFESSNTIPSITFSFLSVDDDTKKSTISLTL